jgi:hypothetical protein
MSLSVEEIERVLAEHKLTDDISYDPANELYGAPCSCGARIVEEGQRYLVVEHRTHVAQALQAAPDAEKEATELAAIPLKGEKP